MRIVMVCIAGLLLGACASAHYFQNPDAPTFAPVSGDSVLVFEKTADIAGEYIELGEIEGTGKLVWNTEGGIIDAMRREAGEKGANAILLKGYSVMGLGESIMDTQEEQKMAKATAIRLDQTEDQPAQMIMETEECPSWSSWC